MVNIKENLWIIVILASIFGIVSIFAPIKHISGEDDSSWFYDFKIFIVIGTLVTLFSGVISKVKDKRLNLVVIIGGILLLIGPLIYFGKITIDEQNIWIFTLNIVLPFFAGDIAILGGILGILMSKS